MVNTSLDGENRVFFKEIFIEMNFRNLTVRDRFSGNLKQLLNILQIVVSD